MATERLILEIRTTGTRTVQRDIGRIRKEARSANRTLALLRSTLVVVASARVIGGFLELSDTLTNIRNRLRLVTNSTEQLNAVQSRLFAISQETRSSFEANAVLFNRLARSTDGLGLSFQDLLDLTRGFNQAAAISGTTAQEARNALIQFSQGLAAGALRGDELRSVVEQFPRLADAIAKGFEISAESTARSLGVTEEALRSAQRETQSLTGGALIAFAKANEGALTTAKIIKALQDDLGALDAEFAKIDITVSQAFTKFQNELTLFIGGISNSIQLGKQLDQVLTIIARNLDIIAVSLAAILAIGVFNIVTSQALRFGQALGGILSFLTTGFTSLAKIILLPFRLLIPAVKLAATGAVVLRTAYVGAFKFILAELALLSTRLGLLRIAIVSTIGGAFVKARNLAVGAIAGIRAALVTMTAALAVVRRSILLTGASFTVLSGIVGRTRAVFIALATGGTRALAALRGALVAVRGVAFTVGAVLTAGLLPAVAIIALLVGGFFAVRAAIQFVESRVGDLGAVFRKVIGGIFGLVDGLVEAFSLLDDAVADIAIEAGNALIDGFEFGINGVIDLLNAIPGVEIDKADLGRFENDFAGSAEQVKEILKRNIAEGAREGFESTDTFQAIENAIEQVRGLLSGGLLPDDFDEAKIQALLDQIAGTRDGLAEVDTEAGKAATSIRKLRAEVDPAEAAFKRINDAFEAFSNISKDNFAATEFARETLRLLAEDILDVVDAERQYNTMLEVVDQAQEKLGLSAERAALARRKLTDAFLDQRDSVLAGVFPLLKAESDLRDIGIELEELRLNGLISTEQMAEAEMRLAREAFGLSKTWEQVNEEIQTLIKNQDLLGLSTAELETQVRKLRIQFLDTQRDAASGAERSLLKFIDSATDAATQTEKLFDSVFEGLTEQIQQFVETGTFSFDQFFRNIAAQLIQLGSQQALGGLLGVFQGATGDTGGFGFGGPASQNAGGGIGGLVTQGLGSLFGFQNGGAFTVGTNTAVASLPGIDNRLIAFRARDNEEVTVTPRGGQVAQAPVNQVFNIQARDADSFRKSQTQIQNRALAGLNQARRRR